MRLMRRLIVVPVVSALLLIGALPASADSGTDFVCPVFNDNAAVGEKNPNAVPIAGGDYTIIPGNSGHLDVPDHATNGDGAGSPGGSHSQPGDRDYSAIWNGG